MDFMHLELCKMKILFMIKTAHFITDSTDALQIKITKLIN